MRKLIWLVVLLWLGASEVQAQITWVNSRNGATGTATGTLPNWNANNIPLDVGTNIITVTYVSSFGTATDTITVTYQPTFPGSALVFASGFETGSGTTAVDSSGVVPANTGTLTGGVAWTTNGKFGNALSFDGVTDYVIVPDSNSLDLTQSFTFSAWVNPSAVHVDWRAIIVKNYVQYLYATTGGTNVPVLCTSGSLFAGFSSQGTPNNICQTSDSIFVGTWTHVAVTYDSADGNLRLYRNGVLVVTQAAAGLMEPSGASLQIGASQFGENFEGLLDEVRVYNYAIPLTAVNGGNTVPGAVCSFGNPLDITQQSVIRDMNCPVVTIASPGPTIMKVPASATGLKLGAGATELKLGH